MRKKLSDFPSGYYNPKLIGVQNEERGRAVFTKERILQGEIISIWGGTVIHKNELLFLDPELLRLSIQIEKDFFLVSDRESLADWFNHSCNPNAGMSGQITLVAIKEIQTNEEVTFDYAFTDSYAYDEFKCLCGANVCRERITAQDWKDSKLQKKAITFFSTYLQKELKKD